MSNGFLLALDLGFQNAEKIGLFINCYMREYVRTGMDGRIILQVTTPKNGAKKIPNGKYTPYLLVPPMCLNKCSIYGLTWELLKERLHKMGIYVKDSPDPHDPFMFESPLLRQVMLDFLDRRTLRGHGFLFGSVRYRAGWISRERFPQYFSSENLKCYLAANGAKIMDTFNY